MEPLFLSPQSTTIFNMIISVDMIQEINHTYIYIRINHTGVVHVLQIERIISWH